MVWPVTAGEGEEPHWVSAKREGRRVRRARVWRCDTRALPWPQEIRVCMAGSPTACQSIDDSVREVASAGQRTKPQSSEKDGESEYSAGGGHARHHVRPATVASAGGGNNSALCSAMSSGGVQSVGEGDGRSVPRAVLPSPVRASAVVSAAFFSCGACLACNHKLNIIPSVITTLYTTLNQHRSPKN